ncbi:MAG: hypothetical protein JWN93_3257 [Hyphomicrobiales bacterium]|nr:hypothetical protein [Hyphomicrobiales bacterium]
MDPGEDRPSNSPERMLAVLDLFDAAGPAWTIEGMAGALGYTRSTLYRYLKSLTDAGLLTSLPGVGYTLGPRIAELDYAMRSRDPLIVAARPIMAQLVADVPGVALLCRRYRARVLCVHQEERAAGFVSTYERGRAQPLLRGAASRVILANLPAPFMRKVLQAHADDLAGAGLGEDVGAARAALRGVRQKGWDATVGDVTPGVTGVAAPVFDEAGTVLGSLSLSVGRRLSPESVADVAQRVMFCARVLTRAASQPAGVLAVP